MLHNDLRPRLEEFVEWVGTHIKGDEKGEAQVYLDRFFQSLRPQRREGSRRDAGGTHQEGGQGHVVRRPRVEAGRPDRDEEARRGPRQALRQAFDYWTRLVPGRPRYVILCNFDEFWVFDFDTQMDEPKDRVRSPICPDSGTAGVPVAQAEYAGFGNDHWPSPARPLTTGPVLQPDGAPERGEVAIDRCDAQRFILQMLVALCRRYRTLPPLLRRQPAGQLQDEAGSYDLIGGLFEAMNTPEKTADNRYQGVDYFNGGVLMPNIKKREWGLF